MGEEGVEFAADARYQTLRYARGWAVERGSPRRWNTASDVAANESLEGTVQATMQ
jgi:hypothetical protein